MRLIIAGTRIFTNYDLLCEIYVKALSLQTEIEVVSGTAKYSDCLIAFWDCKSKGMKHMIDLAKKHKLKRMRNG